MIEKQNGSWKIKNLMSLSSHQLAQLNKALGRPQLRQCGEYSFN
jgi:hypothetical protein